MSIREQALSELKRSEFSESEIVAYAKILDIFFEEWDSGGAVHAAAPVLQRLIAGKCLSPLTGEADEWVDHDGKLAYDIDRPGEFPYWPVNAEVASPVIEITTDAGVMALRAYFVAAHRDARIYWDPESDVADGVLDLAEIVRVVLRATARAGVGVTRTSPVHAEMPR